MRPASATCATSSTGRAPCFPGGPRGVPPTGRREITCLEQEKPADAPPGSRDSRWEASAAGCSILGRYGAAQRALDPTLGAGIEAAEGTGSEGGESGCRKEEQQPARTGRRLWKYAAGLPRAGVTVVGSLLKRLGVEQRAGDGGSMGAGVPGAGARGGACESGPEGGQSKGTGRALPSKLQWPGRRAQGPASTRRSSQRGFWDGALRVASILGPSWA